MTSPDLITRTPTTRWLLAFLLASLLFLPFHTPAAEPSASPTKPIPIARLKRSEPIDFDREILPILNNNCLACHNRGGAKGKLNLETPEDMLRGGNSGPAIVPKQGAKSLLLRAAAHQLDDTLMPPRDNKVQAADLTPEELGLLKLWIDQGARPSTTATRLLSWQPLPPGLNPIYAAAISPDGHLAAAARANQIFLYDLSAKRLLTRLSDESLVNASTHPLPGLAHRSIVSALAFHPDGTWLASASHREVKLWRRTDPATHFLLQRIGRTRLETATLSPNAQWIAVAGDQQPVQLLDARSAKPLRPLRPAPRDVVALQASPDSAELAALGRDGSLHVWTVASGHSLASTPLAPGARALAWLPDGSRLAVGDDSFRIRLFHLDRPRRELTLLRDLRGHDGTITVLTPLPDTSAQLYSASGDGTIRLWNLDDGQSPRQLRHGDAVIALALSPDGKRLASSGLDRTVKLWDATEGKVIAELKGDPAVTFELAQAGRHEAFLRADLDFHRNAVKSAETSRTNAAERVKKAADALQAATKARDEKQGRARETAEARTAADQALEEIKTAHAKAKESLAAATNQVQAAEALIKTARDQQPQDAAAIAGADKSLQAAHAARDQATKEVAAAADREKAATEKATAARKAADDADADLKKAQTAWSTADTEDQLARKGAEAAANKVAESQAALHQAGLAITNAATTVLQARRNADHTRQLARGLAFSPDSRQLATGDDAGTLLLWNAADGQPLGRPISSSAPVASVAFAATNRLLFGTLNRTLALIDTEPRWQLAGRLGTGDSQSPISDRVNALAFSPDGRQLASGGGEPTRGGEILLWQFPEGRLLQSLTNVHSDAVFALDFSPDGRQLASGAADKFARVTDLDTGKVVRHLEGHTHHVLSVSWKRDGRTLATAGADNVVKLWDVPTGERKRNVAGHDKEVTAVQFLPYQDLFLSGSGDTRLRLLKEDGNEVRTFAGSSDFIQAAAISADGLLILAGGQDSTLRVWNATNGQSIATFPPP